LWLRHQIPDVSRKRLFIGLAIIGTIGATVLAQVSKMDWNYLVQKLVILVIWTLVFRATYRFTYSNRPLRRHSMTALFTALALVAGYRILQKSEHILWKHVTWRGGNKPSSAQFLDQYSGHDVPLKLIRDIAAPRNTVDPGFYRFLA